MNQHTGEDADPKDLERRIEKLTKINIALMQRVERSMDQQANAFPIASPLFKYHGSIYL